VDLARLEPECGTDPSAELLLSKLLEQTGDRYDYGIVDCPPHLGLLMRNAIRAADEVVIPVDTGYFSLQGLTRGLETLEEIWSGSRHEVAVRILPNQYDVRTKMAREILAELRKRFGDRVFSTVLNFNTKLKEGASYGQPIVEFAPSSMGARDFQKLAREILAAEPSPTSAAEMLKHVEQMASEAERLLATTATLMGSGKTGGRRAADQEPVSHEEISAKIDSIYGVRQTSEGVVFRNHLPGAQRVQLAGDFNDWMPHTTPMASQKGGADFVTMLKLPPGRYRYRLVVDGRWSHDLANPRVETNEFGELNSIVDVR
jgi:chromosome partitioning protein